MSASATEARPAPGGPADDGRGRSGGRRRTPDRSALTLGDHRALERQGLDHRAEGTTFENLDHVSRGRLRYMIACNEMRPHQGLGGIAPTAFLDTLIAD